MRCATLVITSSAASQPAVWIRGAVGKRIRPAMPDVTAHTAQIGACVDGAPVANSVRRNAGDYRHCRNVLGYNGSSAYHGTEPYSQPWQHERVTENHNERLYDNGGVHCRQAHVVKVVVRR